ncbi:hypothetical protein CYMTET_13981 [Cymbomonas tetramitiformis]|uniref:Uncharacterized protein n=1 Tax=Cymbomonas tetramitiformis TaxID=36881 RepID=A0AAE0F7M3_9CHLO|nr:hypothetical protein CYMTET_37272 [Cymbomonas tetramitiformis]KAK3278051.1 hypothetical protein CYMTET_13981 [Cymbomonas tetramitiformis]
MNLVQVPNQTWSGDPPVLNVTTSFRSADSLLNAPAVGDAKHYAHPVASNFYYTSRSTYKAQSTSNNYAACLNYQMGHNLTDRYRHDWPRYNNILASGTSARLAEAMNGRSFTFSFWTMLDGKGDYTTPNTFTVAYTVVRGPVLIRTSLLLRIGYFFRTRKVYVVIKQVISEGGAAMQVCHIKMDKS